MSTRPTKAEKDAAAAAEAAAVTEIAVHKDGERQADTATSSQPIDLAGQRDKLDELAQSLAGLDAADVGRALDEASAQAGARGELEPAVYLLDPADGHVVHVTVSHAVREGMLGWADATLEDLERAGLTG